MIQGPESRVSRARISWLLFAGLGFIAATATAVVFYSTDRQFQGDGMVMGAIFFALVGWARTRRRA
jgi:hypothetical protein